MSTTGSPSNTEELPKSGFWAFGTSCSLSGIATTDRNAQPPNAQMHLVGAEIFLTPKYAMARADHTWVRQIQGAVIAIITRGTVSPSDDSKLGGRLGFLTSLLMVEIGRAMMIPLVKRQYASNGCPLSDGLRSNWDCRFPAFASLPPRITPLVFRSSAGAHSDAQGKCQADARFNYRKTTTIAFRLPRFCSIAGSIDGGAPPSSSMNSAPPP